MECRHNFHYWNLEPYLAFGPSALRYDGHTRSWNVSSLDTYMQKLAQNKNPISGTEILSKNDHYNETVFNGLRMQEGIELQKLKSLNANSEKMNQTIIKWKERLNVTKDSIRLKNNYYRYADEIASEMMITELQ